MSKVYLYGKLRRFLPDESRMEGFIEFPSTEPENLTEMIASLGLEVDQLSTIFLNSKLLATRNTMASFLQYHQVRASPHNWDLDIAIKPTDRLGIFGMDMGLLVV
ncbi:MAG: hypothetical protein JXA97_12460 [Anaerolineales bacterium]|nr:hypothetical protein [Anaerolineales bacterium]